MNDQVHLLLYGHTLGQDVLFLSPFFFKLDVTMSGYSTDRSEEDVKLILIGLDRQHQPLYDPGVVYLLSDRWAQQIGLHHFFFVCREACRIPGSMNRGSLIKNIILRDETEHMHDI